jgi:hypothetical protein
MDIAINDGKIVKLAKRLDPKEADTGGECKRLYSYTRPC